MQRGTQPGLPLGTISVALGATWPFLNDTIGEEAPQHRNSREYVKDTWENTPLRPQFPLLSFWVAQFCDFLIIKNSLHATQRQHVTSCCLCDCAVDLRAAPNTLLNSTLNTSMPVNDVFQLESEKGRGWDRPSGLIHAPTPLTPVSGNTCKRMGACPSGSWALSFTGPNRPQQSMRSPGNSTNSVTIG